MALVVFVATLTLTVMFPTDMFYYIQYTKRQMS